MREEEKRKEHSQKVPGQTCEHFVVCVCVFFLSGFSAPKVQCCLRKDQICCCANTTNLTRNCLENVFFPVIWKARNPSKTRTSGSQRVIGVTILLAVLYKVPTIMKGNQSEPIQSTIPLHGEKRS